MRRRIAAFAAVLCSFGVLCGLATAAPPPRVQAWYMHGTSLGQLKSNAYNAGCAFARNHPGGGHVLMLDFGAARKIDSNTWGALNFDNVRFDNPSIIAALKSAADGHHNCYTGSGTTDIAYGNNNFHMSGAGMSTSDAWYAGYYQSQRALELFNYQLAKGYNRQSADAGSDMEPSWDGQLITKQLVNGDYGHGFALYWDYGSADGCPSSGGNGGCNNGWTAYDVGYVSFAHLAVPVPEIYFTVSADQWTNIRHVWGDSYSFFGTTGTVGIPGQITPEAGWNALNARNPGNVSPELLCFC